MPAAIAPCKSRASPISGRRSTEADRGAVTTATTTSATAGTAVGVFFRGLIGVFKRSGGDRFCLGRKLCLLFFLLAILARLSTLATRLTLFLRFFLYRSLHRLLLARFLGFPWWSRLTVVPLFLSAIVVSSAATAVTLAGMVYCKIMDRKR